MPVHCKQPMTKVSLLPGTPCPDAAPTHVLQCRCGFRMDAPTGARFSLDSQAGLADAPANQQDPGSIVYIGNS